MSMRRLMQMPEDPHGGEWIAIILAAIATTVGAIWKGWFSFRKDLHVDREHGAHGSLIEELRREVERLSGVVAEMGRKLDEETAQRRRVENENHVLQMRISHLEKLLDGMQP